MLWDLIRDFFVQHVFGGQLSNGEWVNSTLGFSSIFNNGVNDDAYLMSVNDLYYKVGYDGSGFEVYLNMADWLSTTATAISITIIVVLCCMFVYKIVKLIGGLIR